MPWYQAFFTPDAQGFIDSDPNWPSSGVAGGHEIEAVAVELDDTDAFSSVITYVNSWGTGWGDAGRFRMRLRTYQQLTRVDLKPSRRCAGARTALVGGRADWGGPVGSGVGWGCRWEQAFGFFVVVVAPSTFFCRVCHNHDFCFPNFDLPRHAPPPLLS